MSPRNHIVAAMVILPWLLAMLSAVPVSAGTLPAPSRGRTESGPYPDPYGSRSTLSTSIADARASVAGIETRHPTMPGLQPPALPRTPTTLATRLPSVHEILEQSSSSYWCPLSLPPLLPPIYSPNLPSSFPPPLSSATLNSVPLALANDLGRSIHEDWPTLQQLLAERNVEVGLNSVDNPSQLPVSQGSNLVRALGKYLDKRVHIECMTSQFLHESVAPLHAAIRSAGKAKERRKIFTLPNDTWEMTGRYSCTIAVIDSHLVPLQSDMDRWITTSLTYLQHVALLKKFIECNCLMECHIMTRLLISCHLDDCYAMSILSSLPRVPANGICFARPTHQWSVTLRLLFLVVANDLWCCAA